MKDWAELADEYRDLELRHKEYREVSNEGNNENNNNNKGNNKKDEEIRDLELRHRKYMWVIDDMGIKYKRS